MRHREEISQRTSTLLQQNTVVDLSEKARQLTGEIHLRVVGIADTDTMTG
jgi:hypothetical protein